MYTANIKTEVATLRIFKKGESYVNRDTPVFSCTIHFISDTEVYLCNAFGNFSIHVMRAIRSHLKGFNVFRYERHGTMKKVEKTSC